MSTHLQSTLLQNCTISSRQRSLYGRVLKRIIDIFGSAILLLLCSPLMLIVVLVLWISDGRPIFYLRRVMGTRGEFSAYKFRSMCRNADAVLQSNPTLAQEFAQQFKLKSDPRVTRVGRWLRKYSIDELPQLVNVLKGQMSLVGPRMITAQELCKYGECQSLILSVQPGITGYWQTRGRQQTSYEERVEMDIYYITHWNLRLDLRILLETPLTVLRGKGAY